jgi:DNA-binding response OmpR family regulator
MPLLTDPITIRPDEYQVFVHGRRLHLTVREFQTFWALAHNRDKVITRGAIYAEVWGTHFGVGYRFAPELTERGVDA